MCVYHRIEEVSIDDVDIFLSGERRYFKREKRTVDVDKQEVCV